MPDPALALLLALLLTALGLSLYWPKGGLMGRWQRWRRMAARIMAEDALKHIQKSAIKNQTVTLESVAGALEISVNQAADLLGTMEKDGLLTCAEGQVSLTPNGQDAALHIIRAHRLWERFLADETGYGAAEWHLQADRLEHQLSPEDTAALAAQLGNPTHDPHGDPIPTAGGEFVPHGGRPLTALEVNQPARIVHLEDEPEAVAAQLFAEGLYPGMRIQVIETGPRRVRFWANGDEHLLAPIVAANISVVPIQASSAPPPETSSSLQDLRPGQTGRVTQISPLIRGPERRRLMDLGILPGTEIVAMYNSPGGDPVAYRIRGAVIALRREQSGMILIENLGSD